MLWMDERHLPYELLELLDMPITPKDLWAEIVKARDEIDNYGAVTYPTKSRIESLYLKFKLSTDKDD